ncbi:hypothetical protein AWB75_02388 [Caballeronia catudaia]|uniref:Uncharacterized protein n=1 Tax=Caballeronia catudaia TaxID=1777136 RepID=A0A158AM12_9BURK|nr:hypothetical protein AWB75_02388 [Caballeronia catudaia]
MPFTTNSSLVLVPPFVKSIVPALFNVTSCPAIAGRIEVRPMPPARIVLVASRLSVPVPVAASPSVSPFASKVNCVLLDAFTVSQLEKRERPLACTLSSVSESEPGPPSNCVIAASAGSFRLRSTAVSSPAPSVTGPAIVPPLHVSASAPEEVETPCPMAPPVIVNALLPLPRSTRPPIVPPESVNVSSFCAAVTLPSTCPPDMS